MTKTFSPADYISRFYDQTIEEYSSCNNQCQSKIKQLSSGLFMGATTIIRVPGIQITRLSSLASYSVNAIHDTSALFFFPLNFQDYFVNGRVVDHCTQVALPRQTEFFSIVPKNFDQLVIAIEYSALDEQLGAQSKLFVNRLHECAFRKMASVEKRQLTMHIMEFFQRILGSENELKVDVLKQYSSQIISLLDNYLCTEQSVPSNKSSNHEKIINRVITMIEKNISYQYSLDEIAKDVFASKRSIQYAFNSVLGLSPMRFIKLYRLNLVRADIKAKNSTESFSSLVSKYHFSNAGRLVKEYQEFFGERPRGTSPE